MSWKTRSPTYRFDCVRYVPGPQPLGGFGSVSQSDFVLAFRGTCNNADIQVPGNPSNFAAQAFFNLNEGIKFPITDPPNYCDTYAGKGLGINTNANVVPIFQGVVHWETEGQPSSIQILPLTSTSLYYDGTDINVSPSIVLLNDNTTYALRMRAVSRLVEYNNLRADLLLSGALRANLALLSVF